MKAFLVSSLILALFINKSFAQTPVQTVPDFTFFKRDNKPFTKRDLAKDRPLFFVFLDASCEHCQKAVGYIDKHCEGFKKALLYFITLDDAATTDRFLITYAKGLKDKKNVLILWDKNDEFIKDFGPRKYPSMFLFSQKRKLLLYDDDDAALPMFLNLLK